MAPKGRAADALDNIESMLDALHDVNQLDDVCATPEPHTNVPIGSLGHQQQVTNEDENEVEVREAKSSGKVAAKKSTQPKVANSANHKNGPRHQKTAQKRPRKGRARLPRSSPKPSIHKKETRAQEKGVAQVKQVRKAVCKSNGSDPSGLSSQDKVEQQFLQGLKRMAEERLEVENRRREQWNAQIRKKMKIIMGTTETSMRELVGSTASDISKTARSVLNMIPKGLDKQLENLEETVAEERKSLSVLKDSMTLFSETLQNQLKDLRAQVKVNEIEHDEKIKKVTAAAKKTNQKRRDFRNTLLKVEQVLEDNPNPK